MDEDYIRRRVDEILRQKIAMGGCGDYMGYGEGVLVGGRRHRGGVNIGGYGPRRNTAWNKFLDSYMKKHNVTRKVAMIDGRKEYYRELGQPLPPVKAKAKKKAATKKVKYLTSNGKRYKCVPDPKKKR